jgi:hypothetical protein
MSRLPRALPLVASVVLLVLAAVIALFASDVRAWQGALTQGDLRFRTQRSHQGLWRSPAVLPGDPARIVLGLDDALAYRRALQSYWFSAVGASTDGEADLDATRVVAENRLQKLMTTAATAKERSMAADLLGVMTVTEPANSPTQEVEISNATRYFTRAIIEDPTNYGAKLNLEIVLRVQRPHGSHLDEDAHGGFGFGGSNGVGGVGGGF